MEYADVGAEWGRLQATYAGMTEEELEAVAQEGYDLTKIAQQALQGEIKRRGLKVVVRLDRSSRDLEGMNDAGDFDPATLDLAQVWAVESREQAEWVKTTLNEAGIPCYFGPDLRESVDSLQPSAEHPAVVMALKNDHDRIRWVLRDFNNRFPSPDEEEMDFTVHCPKCHSTEVVLLGFGPDAKQQHKDSENSEEIEESDDTEVLRYNESLMQPAPGEKYNWNCTACGYEWADDGVEK